MKEVNGKFIRECIGGRMIRFWHSMKNKKKEIGKNLLLIVNVSFFILALNFLSGNIGIFSATFGRLCALILLALALIINSPLKFLRKDFSGISLFGIGMIRDSSMCSVRDSPFSILATESVFRNLQSSIYNRFDNPYN